MTYETVATLDIEIPQGADFELPLYLAAVDENGNETREDLTGCTLTAEVWSKHTDSSALLTMTCTITDAINGEFLLSIPRASVNALTLTDREVVAFWDFFILGADGKRRIKIRGRALLVGTRNKP